ncbi:hypothetical protein [Roseimaritima ulvae]|uniref:Virginiamycin B lyase n=1 Tax=Roseimaritima ulvae TaxID=980254 RepID=A0A5B9QYI2_9BACT|nr:hypothetical protein [Roseimaritima ulvae]QEG42910.1 Virginiamycin B lyase [Roseimaritima ulvae]
MLIRLVVGLAAVLLLAASGSRCSAQSPGRSDSQKQYAESLWQYLNRVDYRGREHFQPENDFPSGPPSSESSKHFRFVSKKTAADSSDGVIIVTEHYQGQDDTPVAITARRKMADGFDPQNDDWHWVHYTAAGEAVATSADRSPWSKPGFSVFEQDGRLWVFDIARPELAEFVSKGELAKHVIRPGAGPNGMTVKAPDAETLDRYLATKPGFVVHFEDGRLWIFRAQSEALADFRRQGELAKHVIRPGAGPNGVTVKAPDAEVIDAYLVAQPGFVTQFEDGRLWVFRQGSPELKAFREAGELAKHVIRPGAGPDGRTVKGPDAATLDAYLRACGVPATP